MNQHLRPEPLPLIDIAAQRRRLGKSLDQAVGRVLAHCQFINGPEVAQLEAELAEFSGAKHVVTCASGTDALLMVLMAGRIGPGDAVLCPSFTFCATGEAVALTGATPVFVDIGPESYNLDPERIREAISPSTKAIMPVHLFGRICNVDAVLAISERAHVAVIEDACQAHGATLGGKRAGSFGLSAAFSFYPAKNLGCFGDGGMLVTRSEAVATAARALRNYGQRRKYEHVALPLNHRLDTIQAAVLRVKLPHLNGWNARRRRLAAAYRQQLAGLPVALPAIDVDGRHVYHLFVIETDRRDDLRAYLLEQGIETGVHYPIPLHLQPVLGQLGYPRGAFPNAERLAAQSLSLPMYPELSLEQVEQVTTAIRRFFGD